MAPTNDARDKSRSPRGGHLAPTAKLPNGSTMPLIGMGTQDMINWEDADRIGRACVEGLKMGYRHFDCAPAYQNHRAVGAHLRKALEETGMKRSEIFVTSKLANDGHTKVREHLKRTLEELGLEYLDLYLIHWPWPNYHPPGCHGDFINPESRHYVHKLYMETYRELEKAYDEGLVKNIGVSNMTVPKMQLLLRDCRVKPACNQVEIHLHFQQEALVRWHQQHGIVVTGYFPLGSPGRADRDKAAHHTVPLQDPVLVKLAAAKGCSVAQAALKFQIQRGVVVIPQSANPEHMRSNLASSKLSDFSQEQMSQLLATDKNIRFIAGQVFNWKKGMDWHDLWDDLGNDSWDGPINGVQAALRPAAELSVAEVSLPAGCKIDGKQVRCFELVGERIRVQCLSYGCILNETSTPDKNGTWADVVVGFDVPTDFEGYASSRMDFFGCVCGRVANRVRAGQFQLDGQTYQLPTNNGPNSLHGGDKGWNTKLWEVESFGMDAAGEPYVCFSYVSAHLEMGYPGEVKASVRYSLPRGGDALRVDYKAVSDRPTVLNMTNHSYYNLSGDFSKTILDHELLLNADHFTPVDETLIPLGEHRPVKGTIFDFKTGPRRIGQDVGQVADEQIKRGQGYDHNFVLAQDGESHYGGLNFCAQLKEPTSGRLMEIYTEEPGVQFYSGNFMDAKKGNGKKGVPLGHRTGLCLETHHFPDSPNRPHYPSVQLRPNAPYHSATVFKFSTAK